MPRPRKYQLEVYLEIERLVKLKRSNRQIALELKIGLSDVQNHVARMPRNELPFRNHVSLRVRADEVAVVGREGNNVLRTNARKDSKPQA